MYLYSTNEAQILYHVWFKSIERLHGLEVTFRMKLSLFPLLHMKFVSHWKGKSFFFFTLSCLAPTLDNMHGSHVFYIANNIQDLESIIYN